MKLKIVIILLFFACSFSLAQNSSTYSRLGIGDFVYSYSGRSLGMGESGVALSDDNFIGIINPAGWHSLTRTRVEFGGNYNGLFLSNNSLKKYYSETEFTGFTFGFPISRQYGIGAAIGIVPFSNISYKASNYNSAESGITGSKISYEGTGGLSKMFIGTSYTLPIDVSIGATLDYYFGNLKYSSLVDLDGTGSYQTKFLRDYRPNGIGTTVGVIGPNLSNIFDSKHITNFRIGIAANIFSKLSTDTLLTYSSPILDDTIASGAVKMDIPTRITAGVNLELNKNYRFNLDYTFQPFQNYTFNGAKFANLRNITRFNSGFEYKPQIDIGATFWEQISWRAGLSYEQTQYKVNGTGINQFSVSGGLSLPLGIANSLDLAIEYSVRGTTDMNLLKENIIKLGVGISFGEIWFIRHEK
jgi:hypothetical protein